MVLRVGKNSEIQNLVANRAWERDFTWLAEGIVTWANLSGDPNVLIVSVVLNVDPGVSWADFVTP